MSDIAALHRAALAATRPRIVAITADQWSAPTGCGGWDVRQLVNHIISGNLWAAELAAGGTIAEVGDRFDGDVAGADPVAAYDESAELAAAAFEAPGALDAPCAVSYGPVPGSLYAGHRFVDVLIHGWDVAAATGQDRTLDPGAGVGLLGRGDATGRPAQGQRHVRHRGHAARGGRQRDPAAGRARARGLRAQPAGMVPSRPAW